LRQSRLVSFSFFNFNICTKYAHALPRLAMVPKDIIILLGMVEKLSRRSKC